MNIQDFIKFTELTVKFQQVKRAINAVGEERMENDLEHSGQLALHCWYFLHEMKLDLDLELIFKYSLTHDIVEIYAGDTYAHETDKNIVDSKSQRENDAIKKIQSEFPTFEFEKLWHDYENLVNKEAKFVAAMDKFLPIVNIYLDHGRSWKRLDVNLDMITSAKDKKISNLDSDVYKLYIEMFEILKENAQELGIGI